MPIGGKKVPTAPTVTHRETARYSTPRTPRAVSTPTSKSSHRHLRVVPGGKPAGALVALYRGHRESIAASLADIEEHRARVLDELGEMDAIIESLAGSGGRPPSPLLTIGEAADHLNVSRSTVNRLIANGELPVVRITSAPRVRRVDIDDYIARR